MNKLTQEKTVDNQYRNSNNLNIRIKLHEKYSTNKKGFNNWVVENYSIDYGIKILEIGCGTGITWKDKTHLIEKCEEVRFTDLSERMLLEAEKNIGKKDNFYFEQVNAENLPYPNENFDIVIANMMLYHIPNLENAINEIKRVMKPKAIFYSATYGENGVESNINKILNIKDDREHTFTLQNGENVLSKYFGSVEKLEYIDQLNITEKDDLIEYIQSFQEMNEWKNYSEQELKDKISKYENDGVITIPKEYGMFVSMK